MRSGRMSSISSQRDLIVAAHFNLRPQFADVLDQVVGEGIVVVEDENQCQALLNISLHRNGSLAGSAS